MLHPVMLPRQRDLCCREPIPLKPVEMLRRRARRSGHCTLASDVVPPCRTLPHLLTPGHTSWQQKGNDRASLGCIAPQPVAVPAFGLRHLAAEGIRHGCEIAREVGSYPITVQENQEDLKDGPKAVQGTVSSPRARKHAYIWLMR
jgi:hypothetical protein